MPSTAKGGQTPPGVNRAAPARPSTRENLFLPQMASVMHWLPLSSSAYRVIRFLVFGLTPVPNPSLSTARMFLHG